MKTLVFVLTLAAVLAVANCAPYQIAYVIPEDATLVRVARSPQFSSARSRASAYSSGYGGFSRASSRAQSYSGGGRYGGFSGSYARASASSYSG